MAKKLTLTQLENHLMGAPDILMGKMDAGSVLRDLAIARVKES